MRNTRSLNKFLVLKLFFGLVFGVLVLRLASIQVLSHDEFRKKAYNQQYSRKTLDNERGKIYSSDNYILATNSISYTLIMNPSVIKNLELILDQLSEKIIFENQDEKKAFFENNKRNFNPDSKYLRVIKDLTREEMEEIEKLNLIGISFEKEIERFYPESPLATSVLGFVAPLEKRGYFGVEGRNDKLLRGREGLMLYERGADGEVILYGNYDKQDSINGDSLVLTIDRTVQFIIEKKLKEHISKTGATSGQIIVMDPETGNILGMASYPSFDPYNPYGEYLDSDKKVKSELRNLAIFGVEPGSVIKPLTIATGLDLGVINQGYTYQDNGVLRISDKEIDNWDKKHHGTMDLLGLLEKSNNIGASLVALKIGDSDLKKYLKKYGFGRSTDIDLEGEQIGSLNPRYTSDIDTASIGFGQGFTATPLQVLASYSVFINDGNLVKPKIIKKIIKPDNTEIVYPNLIEKNVIKKEVSDYIDELLTKSMKANESKFFNLKNYHIAGKTGTAQYALDGKYVDNKTNTFFVGYMPTSKKFSMITRLEDPKSSPYAAETAVPFWMETATELLNFYNIPPDISY